MPRRPSLAAARQVLAWLLGLGLLVVVLLYLAGVFEQRIAPTDDPGTARTATTADGPTAVAERVEEDVLERFPGTVRAVRQAVVSARIIANVLDVLVRPGDTVEADATLAVLDSRELVARERQAREWLAAAEARRTQADAEYARMQALLQDGSVSRSIFEQAEAAARTARADVEAGRRRLEEAQVALTWAEIRAPFAAVVSERFVDPGDQAAPGVALLKVYDPARMRLEAHVRESLAVRLEAGTEVRVDIDALDRQVPAAVEEIVPQAETGSRTLLVKVGLRSEARLYPGTFGRLLLSSGRRQRVLIPVAALRQAGQLYFVDVASPEPGRRMVVPGPAAPDGRIEILSGLEAGERVRVPGAR